MKNEPNATCSQDSSLHTNDWADKIRKEILDISEAHSALVAKNKSILQREEFVSWSIRRAFEGNGQFSSRLTAPYEWQQVSGAKQANTSSGSGRRRKCVAAQERTKKADLESLSRTLDIPKFKSKYDDVPNVGGNIPLEESSLYHKSSTKRCTPGQPAVTSPKRQQTRRNQEETSRKMIDDSKEVGNRPFLCNEIAADSHNVVKCRDDQSCIQNTCLGKTASPKKAQNETKKVIPPKTGRVAPKKHHYPFGTKKKMTHHTSSTSDHKSNDHQKHTHTSLCTLDSRCHKNPFAIDADEPPLYKVITARVPSPPKEMHSDTVKIFERSKFQRVSSPPLKRDTISHLDMDAKSPTHKPLRHDEYSDITKKIAPPNQGRMNAKTVEHPYEYERAISLLEKIAETQQLLAKRENNIQAQEAGILYDSFCDQEKQTVPKQVIIRTAESQGQKGKNYHICDCTIPSECDISTIVPSENLATSGIEQTDQTAIHRSSLNAKNVSQKLFSSPEQKEKRMFNMSKEVEEKDAKNDYSCKDKGECDHFNPAITEQINALNIGKNDDECQKGNVEERNESNIIERCSEEEEDYTKRILCVSKDDGVEHDFDGNETFEGKSALLGQCDDESADESALHDSICNGFSQRENGSRNIDTEMEEKEEDKKTLEHSGENKQKEDFDVEEEREEKEEESVKYQGETATKCDRPQEEIYIESFDKENREEKNDESVNKADMEASNPEKNDKEDVHHSKDILLSRNMINAGDIVNDQFFCDSTEEDDYSSFDEPTLDSGHKNNIDGDDSHSTVSSNDDYFRDKVMTSKEQIAPPEVVDDAGDCLAESRNNSSVMREFDKGVYSADKKDGNQDENNDENSNSYSSVGPPNDTSRCKNDGHFTRERNSMKIIATPLHQDRAMENESLNLLGEDIETEEPLTQCSDMEVISDIKRKNKEDPSVSCIHPTSCQEVNINSETALEDHDADNYHPRIGEKKESAPVTKYACSANCVGDGASDFGSIMSTSTEEEENNEQSMPQDTPPKKTLLSPSSCYSSSPSSQSLASLGVGEIMGEKDACCDSVSNFEKTEKTSPPTGTSAAARAVHLNSEKSIKAQEETLGPDKKDQHQLLKKTNEKRQLIERGIGIQCNLHQMIPPTTSSETQYGKNEEKDPTNKENIVVPSSPRRQIKSPYNQHQRSNCNTPLPLTKRNKNIIQKDDDFAVSFSPSSSFAPDDYACEKDEDVSIASSILLSYTSDCNFRCRNATLPSSTKKSMTNDYIHPRPRLLRHKTISNPIQQDESYKYSKHYR